jgi:hypothetical protein
MQVELTWYTKGGDLYVKDAEGKAPADPFVLKGVNVRTLSGQRYGHLDSLYTLWTSHDCLKPYEY